jgi:hypothetical protein
LVIADKAKGMVTLVFDNVKDDHVDLTWSGANVELKKDNEKSNNVKIELDKIVITSQTVLTLEVSNITAGMEITFKAEGYNKDGKKTGDKTKVFTVK